MVDPDHPSAAGLPTEWEVYDEAYNFESDPADLDKTYVLTADQSTIKENDSPVSELHENEGDIHPIAWYKEGDLLNAPSKHLGGGVDNNKHIPKKQQGTGGDGRAYYTALGHTKECWTDDVFLGHILGAMQWVLASPTITSNTEGLDSSAPGSEYEGLTASVANSTSSSASTDSSDGATEASSSGTTASVGSGTGSGVSANNSKSGSSASVLGAATSSVARTATVSTVAVAFLCFSAALAFTISTSA